MGDIYLQQYKFNMANNKTNIFPVLNKEKKYI